MSTPFDPRWLEPRAVVPVDIETTVALVQELKQTNARFAQLVRAVIAAYERKNGITGDKS